MNLIERFNLTDKISIDELESKLDIFRKYQQFVYGAIVIIVALQLIFGVVMPSINEYNNESKSLRQYRRVLKLKQAQAADKENIRLELERLQSVLDDKKQVFFNEDDVKEFMISGFSNMVAANDIQLNSMVYKKTSLHGKDIHVYPMDIKITSNFENLMFLFNELESYAKVVKINSVDVRRKSVDPVELTVSLVIDLYVNKESK